MGGGMCSSSYGTFGGRLRISQKAPLGCPQWKDARHGIAAGLACRQFGGTTSRAKYFLDDRSVEPGDIYGVVEVRIGDAQGRIGP
jgi:hypothetical protein